MMHLKIVHEGHPIGRVTGTAGFDNGKPVIKFEGWIESKAWGEYRVHALCSPTIDGWTVREGRRRPRFLTRVDREISVPRNVRLFVRDWCISVGVPAVITAAQNNRLGVDPALV